MESAARIPRPGFEMELVIRDPALAGACAQICRMVKGAGGRALAVGGCVRDAALGRPVKDLDLEVYGIQPASLRGLLAPRYPLDLVGQAFAVLKLRALPVDVSVPRRESKIGLGHTAFDVLSDPGMPPAEAASRRDFTVNAMMLDPLTGELLDPFGGMADLDARVLRHTSGRFSEDPLRVLRGMQFAARFELAPAPETVELCRGIEPEGLSRERVFEEWRKLVLLGNRPSLGLSFLKDTGWLKHFPELASMVGCAQEPDWHPEGDVWTHTLHAMDAFAVEREGDEREDLVVGLAVLCHDLGKPATTRFDEGRLRSLGHDKAGEEPARAFLVRLTNQEDLVSEIVTLVACHLRPLELYKLRASDAAVRRLSRKVGRIDRLVRVARADSRARPPMEFDGFPAGAWLLERARALDVAAAAPKPLVMGRHLIELGLAPGPRFGELIEACYEAQLDGRFADLEGGLAFVRGLLGPPEAAR